MEISRRGYLVVLEQGAPWPEGVLESSTDGVVIIHARADETDRQLLERVMLCCSAQAEGGISFHTAVLCCSGDGDARRMELRTNIACGLLSQLLAGAEGRLVLVTDDRRGPTANSLLGLAGALMESLAGSNILIDVVAEPRPLGVRPISRPATIRSARRRINGEQSAQLGSQNLMASAR